MTDSSRILMQLTANSTEGRTHYLKLIRQLIIDDRGIERNTGFAAGQVYNAIDYRIKSSIPMIIATNMTVRDVKSIKAEAYGREYERIWERCISIVVTGIGV